MKLKACLKEALNDDIDDFKAYIKEKRSMLKVLKLTNMNKATYFVEIASRWSHEGEKSVHMEHEGTLKNAVKKAEKEFMEINHRKDIQADYHVKLSLGENGEAYAVPEEYYKAYKHVYKDEPEKKPKKR